MVKASSVIKAEQCEESEWDFADQQMIERKRILKLVSNFKSSDIKKPAHKRSARLATKAAKPAPLPAVAPEACQEHDDLEAALISTDELFLDNSIDDCWFPQANNNTILADMDEISAELDLDDCLSCSSSASDCTIPDSSDATSLDDILDVGEVPKEVRKKERKKRKAPAPKPVVTVPPEVPPQHPYAAAAPQHGPMRLNLGKTASAAPGMRLPYQYVGVTLSMGGRKPAAYTRKPVAVHGGQRIRAHLGFAANLAAVCASL